MNETGTAFLVIALLILIPLFLVAGLLAGAFLGWYFAMSR